MGSFNQDTGESTTLCDQCPGIFYDLSESRPRFYVSSEGRHPPQHRVPVTARGHRGLMFLARGKSATYWPDTTSSSNSVFPVGLPSSTNQAHTCLASEIQLRQGCHWSCFWPDQVHFSEKIPLKPWHPSKMSLSVTQKACEIFNYVSRNFICTFLLIQLIQYLTQE